MLEKPKLYVLNSSYTAVSWSVSGGTYTSSGNTIYVTWTSAGFNSVGGFASYGGSVDPVPSLSVNVSAVPPAKPTDPIVQNNACGSSSISRNNPPSGVTWYWQGTNANGTSTSNSASTYTATSSGTYYLRAYESSTNLWSTSSGSVSVTVLSALSAGTISGAQTICYNGNPAAFTGTFATGCNGSYAYQWQISTNNSSWTDISGATSATYDAGNLTSSRWYRRKVTSNGSTLYTSSIKVTVNPTLSVGSITGAQTICYNGNPSILGNGGSASGGNGSITYTWQYSNNGSSGWTDISGTNATTYDPPANLTSSRWYRRKAVSCGETKYTSSVKVTVNPTLSVGSISGAQTVCYNGDPSTLTNSASASGGNGSIAYQWQYSTNGSSNWTNISGATSTTYNPGNLTSSRWYRRRAISCGETKYTNTVKVTVNPTLSVGSISGAQTICYDGNPATLTSTAAASGGNGSITYTWQYSNNGSSGWDRYCRHQCYHL